MSDEDLFDDHVGATLDDEPFEFVAEPRPLYPGRLRRGDRGPGVETLQHALGVTVDGYFGHETDEALRLLVDGARMLTPEAWEAVCQT